MQKIFPYFGVVFLLFSIFYLLHEPTVCQLDRWCVVFYAPDAELDPSSGEVLYQLQPKGTADPMVGWGFEGIQQRTDAVSGGTWVKQTCFLRSQEGSEVMTSWIKWLVRKEPRNFSIYTSFFSWRFCNPCYGFNKPKQNQPAKPISIAHNSIPVNS